MPGDTRPHVAREAKKRHRAPAAGTLDEMRGKLWAAVLAAARAVERAEAGESNDGVLRGVHAITQASGAYARIVEAGELEARLAELEKAVAAREGRT